MRPHCGQCRTVDSGRQALPLRLRPQGFDVGFGAQRHHRDLRQPGIGQNQIDPAVTFVERRDRPKEIPAEAEG